MTDEPHRIYAEETDLTPDARARILARARNAAETPVPAGLGLGWIGAAVALGIVALMWTWSPTDPALDAVQLVLDGEGTVGGTEAAPEIEWHAGTLGVEVEPGQGVTLEVRTEEAVVQVVGTAFEVHREHYATDVSVDHGVVRVTCVGQEPVLMRSGDRRRCLPDTTGPLLLRVAALATHGASHDDRIEALDRAAPKARPGSVAQGELMAHRAKALADAAMPDAALHAARAYLEAGHEARRAELWSFVARTEFERQGCGAKDTLERAVSVLPAATEALLLATCVLPDDPVRARELAQAALDGSLSEQWRTVAERILDHGP